MSDSSWYRRETWLVPTLGSFVPVSVGFATPDRFHVLLLGMSGVMLVVGLIMLLRHGVTRTDAEPARAARERQAA